MRYLVSETMTDKVFYLFDSFLQWANYLIKASPTAFIDAETTEGTDTIVFSDGSLMTAINIHGSNKTVLGEDVAKILDDNVSKFQSYMTDGSHYFSTYFLRDPDGIEEEIEHVYGGSRAAAAAIGLDMEDIIDEQVAVLTKFCQKETAYILLWSNQNGLNKTEKKLAKKRRRGIRKGLPLANNAQDLGVGADVMLKRHKSYVSEVCSNFAESEISTSVLTSHEILREIRASIDSEYTGSDWQPILPNDKAPHRIENTLRPDYSGLLWPMLKNQLFPRPSEQLDHATVKVGNKIFSPISIELQPRDPEPFQALFKKLNAQDIPWRIHSLVRNDGMSVLGFKEIMASFMQFTPGADCNDSLVNVKNRLKALQASGEEIVKLQITLCTWAPANDRELLEMRHATLVRCVQGWGNCEVAPAEGDPLETMMSSTPGGVIGSVGNVSAAPLYDTLKMAPLTRPASAFPTGSQPFRTPDGKLMPFQPYSKLQTAWVTLICGPMGYGKSVFMNFCNLSLILNADNTELPFISILDIGPSSRGLIMLIKGALPAHKKYLAAYYRLKNSAKYAVNVFDLPLGLRRPLSTQKDYLANLLSFLATPEDAENPEDCIPAMAEELVKLLYSITGDRLTAKPYVKGILPDIDKLAVSCGLEFKQNKTRWYDVVDLLAKNDHTHEATLAQRYAVPTLEDAARYAQDDRITAIYGEAKVSTSETAPKYMWRKLAAAISEFPIIAEVTSFDIGESRIVSLDLDEVARGGNKRKVGLMYMVAYYILTHKFFTGVEHLDEMEGEVGIYNFDYRPYHKKFIDSISRMPKRFCIDEKHRINGLGRIESQLDQSIVEGRKWKVEIMQSSQRAKDFSEKSLEFATNVFIIGNGNAKNCIATAKTFALSNTMSKLLRKSLRKPGKKGATFLSILKTDNGDYEQLLVSSQGPIFLWACNSSNDDAYVRDTLTAKIGDLPARALLVEFYPAGNLDDEIEKRKLIISAEYRDKMYEGEDLGADESIGEETNPSILREIVDELWNIHKIRNTTQALAA